MTSNQPVYNSNNETKIPANYNRDQLRWCLPAIAINAIAFGAPYLNSKTNILGIQPVVAQRIASSDAWRQLYQRLPEFPLENKYVSKKTRKVSQNHTLARRLIRYHIYIKGRAPNTRLDWKLTLADYLGANEIMYDSSYPGSDILRKNPIDGDQLRWCLPAIALQLLVSIAVNATL